MTPAEQKIERLAAMADRLTEALDADIAALEAGRPKALRMVEPDIQKLSLVYAREAKTFDRESAKAAPPAARNRLRTATERFGTALKRHMRLVTRVRSASEGIVRAVAADIERKRAVLRPYAPPRSHYTPPPQAIVYNAVV